MVESSKVDTKKGFKRELTNIQSLSNLEYIIVFANVLNENIKSSFAYNLVYEYNNKLDSKIDELDNTRLYSKEITDYNMYKLFGWEK